MSDFSRNFGGVGAPGNTGGDGDQPQRNVYIPHFTESGVLRCVSDDLFRDAFQQPAPTETTHGAQPENTNETRPTLNTQAADSGPEESVSPSIIEATARPTSPEVPPFEGSYDAGDLSPSQQQTSGNAGEMMPPYGGPIVGLDAPPLGLDTNFRNEAEYLDMTLDMPTPDSAHQDHRQEVQSPQAALLARDGTTNDMNLNINVPALGGAQWVIVQPVPAPQNDLREVQDPQIMLPDTMEQMQGYQSDPVPGPVPGVRQAPMVNLHAVEGHPDLLAYQTYPYMVPDPLVEPPQQNGQGQFAPTMQGLTTAAAMPFNVVMTQVPEDDEIDARNDPMMQAQTPAPAPANNRGRGRAARAPRGAAAARARPRPNQDKPAPAPVPEPVTGSVAEVPLEPWMENKFLLYMEAPNRERNSLMRWDRTRLGEPRGLVIQSMSTFKRYETMLQVIHAVNDAKDAWSAANGSLPTETELHWPSVSDMKLDNNGVVSVFPETLVNPVPPRTHRFQDLVRELLGGRYEGTRDPIEYLFERAGMAFNGNSETVAEWRNLLPGVMSASLDMVCGAMARDHRIPPECTKAVLQLIMEEGNTVTLEAFCKSARVFGQWWEGAMARSLEDAVGDRTHFYIATSQQASEYLMRQEGLGFIIRPRHYYDAKSDGAEWPFALTLLVNGTVEHYVVSFQGGMFRVENMELEDPSIVNLAYRFARSRGVYFIE